MSNTDTEVRHYLIGMQRRDYYNQFDPRIAITATSGEVMDIVGRLNRENSLMDGSRCGSIGTSSYYKAKGLAKNFHSKEEFDTYFTAEVEANLRYAAEKACWQNLGSGY